MEPIREWEPNFTCPHCGQNTYIYAEEYCPVTNSVELFTVNGYEEDEHGGMASAEDVDVDWGKSEIGENDGYHEQYYCGYCRECIDDDLRDTAELFNWLYKRGMLCQASTSKSSTG